MCLIILQTSFDLLLTSSQKMDRLKRLFTGSSVKYEQVSGFAVAHDFLIIPEAEWKMTENWIYPGNAPDEQVSVTLIASDRTGRKLYFLNIGAFIQLPINNQLNLLPNLRDHLDEIGDGNEPREAEVQQEEGKTFDIKVLISESDGEEFTCKLRFSSLAMYSKWHKVLRESLTEAIFKQALSISSATKEISVIALEEAIQRCSRYVSIGNVYVQQGKRVWNLKLEMHQLLTKLLATTTTTDSNTNDGKTLLLAELSELLVKIDKEQV